MLLLTAATPAVPAPAADAADAIGDDGHPAASPQVSKPLPGPGNASGAAPATVAVATTNPAGVDPAADVLTALQPSAERDLPSDRPATATAAAPDKASPRDAAVAGNALPAAAAPAAVAVAQPTFIRSLADAAAALAPAQPHHAALALHDGGWTDQLADQVQWQIGHAVQEAQLQLHPRELGSVQVQLRMSASGVEVQFAAAHPQAREALAAALPQLRSLLADGGLQLAQAQVGAQSQFQTQAQAQSQPQWQQPFRAPGNPPARGSDAAAAADDDIAPVRRVVRVGLVDDFA